MPIITMPDPLTAASNAVGGYTQQKNENRDRALAAATERARLSMQERGLSDQERAQAKAEELETRRLDETHAVNLRNEQHQQFEEQLQKEEADFQKKYRPLMLQLVQAKIRGEDVRQKMEALQYSVAQDEARLQKWMTAHGIPQQQAELNLQQIRQNLAQSAALTALYTHEANQPYRNPGALTEYQKFEIKKWESEHGPGTSNPIISLQKSPKFSALPATVQDLVIKKLKGGASLQGVIADIQGSPLSDEQKKTTIDALQIGPTPTPSPTPSPKTDAGPDAFKHGGAFDQALLKSTDIIGNLALLVAGGTEIGPGLALAKQGARLALSRLAKQAGTDEVTLVTRAVQKLPPQLMGQVVRKVGPARVVGEGGGPIEQGGGFESYGPNALGGGGNLSLGTGGPIEQPGGFGISGQPMLPGGAQRALPGGGPIAQPGARIGQPGSGVSALEALQAFRTLLGL